MKISVLGSTGMLGNAVGKHFLGRYGDDNVVLTYRNEGVSYGKNKIFFDPLSDDISEIPDCEYCINCIGVINKFMPSDSPNNVMANSIYINSIFPRKLAEECFQRDIRLINITTDCVFSGKDGKYTERSVHDALDEYGKSKSLGETSKCMTIRTSIIGEELHKNASLISWAKSQRGGCINGFTNHFWNGMTTNQYANICDQIIENSLYEQGIFHVFSDAVSKFELLVFVNNKFNLDLKISPIETEIKCDRTLCSVKNLINELSIPCISKQIENL